MFWEKNFPLLPTHDTFGLVHCPSDWHVIVNGLPSRKKPSLHKNLTVEPFVLYPTAIAFLGASGAGHDLAIQNTGNTKRVWMGLTDQRQRARKYYWLPTKRERNYRLATKKKKNTEIYRNRQRSKILTDNRQSNEILTDNRHVDLPIQTLYF